MHVLSGIYNLFWGKFALYHDIKVIFLVHSGTPCGYKITADLLNKTTTERNSEYKGNCTGKNCLLGSFRETLKTKYYST